MRFPRPLVKATLVRRYKRFLADVVLEAPHPEHGAEVTVHTPNPGAMLGLAEPGFTVWLAPAKATAKLPFGMELVEAVDPQGRPTLVGVNTLNPNRIVAEALAAGAIPELAGYAQVRPEVRYGVGSRVDFLLTGPDGPPCWLEVKNCHLRRHGALAEFPDCVAARSLKHLRELTAEVEAGARSVMLFVIQREDCDSFAAAADCDPAYAAGLEAAARAGVEVLAYGCDMSLTAVTLARRLPWRDGPADADAGAAA